MNQELKTVKWATDELVPYARSLRKNAHAVDRMAEAIEAFGFKIPILIRGNGEVIDGELRLKAAKKLRMEEVPVILCDDWSEAQVKAFRLLVNRSASWATSGATRCVTRVLKTSIFRSSRTTIWRARN